MEKKSQVTVFIVLGLVLVLFAGLGLYVIKNSSEKSEGEVDNTLVEVFDQQSLKQYIEGYILLVSPEPIIEIGFQGGTLNLSSGDFIWNNKKKHHTLCYHLEGHKGCVNTLLLRQQMEEELSKEIKSRIMGCINLTVFEEMGFSVKTGEMDIYTTIGSYDVSVKLDYPIELTKPDQIITLSKFYSDFDYPLGELYQLAIDIINTENIDGSFNKDEFMVQDGVSIIVEKHRPYPDIAYSLFKKIKSKENYTFNFAINGEGTIEKIGEKIPQEFANGCCFNSYDNLCFKNADPVKCSAFGLEYIDNKDCGCNLLYEKKGNLCNGGICDDCRSTYNYEDKRFNGPPRKHGESWCSYDSVLLSKVGTGGMSYVGSRHYLHSCINGKEYVEECRDFREELCTQQEISGLTKAVCRINRWSDCFECDTKECCEDKELRDCYWSGWLSSQNKCHPIIPPGFKFWDGNGLEVCTAATEYKRCDGFSCPNKWVDDTALYCYFMGDCGSYRNIADRLTKNGFFNSDPTDTVRSYVFHQSGLNKNPVEIGRKPLTLDLTTTGQRKEAVHFPEPTEIIPLLLSAGFDYLDYLSSISISDVLLNPSDLDVEVLDYSICGLWMPPLGGNDCNLCAEPFKPCTEYRCKSLGELCVYEEHRGVGDCTVQSDKDIMPPSILFDEDNLPDKYDSEPTKMEIVDSVIEGVEITPEIKTSNFFTFGIITTEPTRCKLGYLPNISYRYLPSVWFGDAVFSTKHNISLRMPSTLIIPNRIYQVLNITKLEELMQIFDDPVGTYEKYKQRYSSQIKLYKSFTGYDPIAKLDPFIKLGLQFIQNFSKMFLRIKAIAEIMLPDFENNKYYLFVRCIDKSGNENKEEFFIKFTVKSPENDTAPPEILKTEPENFAIIAGNQTNVTFQVFTNELAECRYSLADQDYNSMPYELACPTSVYKISSIMGGTYECLGSLPLTGHRTTYYIRCQDNPPKEENYKINMITSTEFKSERTESRYFNLTQPNILDVTSSLLDGTRIEIASNSLHLNLYIDDTSYCRYASEDKDFDEMVNPFSCIPAQSEFSDLGIYKCSADMQYSESIFITCRDVNVTKRNTNTESYVVAFFKE